LCSRYYAIDALDSDLQPCAVTCSDGLVHCDVELLVTRSPLLKELFSGVRCYCAGPGLALPNLPVNVVVLALNLLLAEEGIVKVNESLLAAHPRLLPARDPLQH
jgi:hypothetical protein